MEKVTKLNEYLDKPCMLDPQSLRIEPIHLHIIKREYDICTYSVAHPLAIPLQFQKYFFLL